jgi:hypothetical protein
LEEILKDRVNSRPTRDWIIKPNRWTLQDIYASKTECSYAEVKHLRGPFDPCRTDSGFFRHGITYVPEKEHNSCFRKVIILGLDKQTSLLEVLENIRGGPLESINLLNTSFMDESASAMVTFLDGYSATQYVSFVEMYGLPRLGQRVSVKLIPSPTYPLSWLVVRALSTQDCSHCLSIPDWPQRLPIAKIQAIMEHLSRMVVEDVGLFDRCLRLRFGSLRMALNFKDILESHEYRLQAGFYADPTSLPLHTLLEPLPAQSTN